MVNPTKNRILLFLKMLATIRAHRSDVISCVYPVPAHDFSVSMAWK
jgi:hypothetical protein